MNEINLQIQILAKLLGGEVSGNQILAPGPGHSAIDRSLSVKLDVNAPDGFVTHSFAGDDPIECRDHVRAKAGLEPFKPNREGRGRASDDAIERALVAAVSMQERAEPPKGRVVASYEYPNGEGALLYQVQRLEPKAFRQRRPNGKGDWIWSLEGVCRVPYRLPELLRYPDATIFVCEGEKDADRVASLGHCATTVACGKWTDDCVKALAGRDVVILQDNDTPGAKKALTAAQALHGTAKSVRIILLPDLPERGDVSDWLDAEPQRAEKLIDICFNIGEWRPDTASQNNSEFEKTRTGLTEEVKITNNDGAKKQEQKDDNNKKPPIQWLDMSTWDDEPRPEREWAIPDRVPLNQAGLFSGEGGAGKSIMEMMKDVAHVAGKDWLGSLPALGPAIYVGAEDDEREIHIRFYDIANHYGITFRELITGGLHVLCKLGQDATLCALTRSGKVETTDLYRQLYEAAGDLKPKNISIDTLSRAFAGNEIDRVQVYAFAMHMQALAMVARGSVTVLSHPSLQGIASGSGISGSTAWHGAFRFRQYLKGTKPDNSGEQPDGDLRELEFKKNQYGPSGDVIVVRYQRGLFLPVGGMSNLDKLATEQAADNLFLELLNKFQAQGRNVSHLKTANCYAPTMFTKDPKAGAPGIHKALADAMERLFAAKKIRVEPYGKPSRQYHRIAHCD